MAVDRHTHVNDTSEEQTEMKAASLFLGTARRTNSLDASGGSVFLKLLDVAKGALIRAAASTQTLDCC